MLKRYGGPLEKPVFDSLSFCTLKFPPLSNFAMFAECKANAVEQKLDFRNLSRPTARDSMPTEQRETGREPVILRVLAQQAKGDEKKDKEASPKRKRSKSATTKKTGLSIFMEDS
jgi:hypothetical protein